MLMIWASLAGTLLYMEIVYHFGCFGWSGCNPLYALFLILIWSAAMSAAVSAAGGRWKKILYYGFLWLAAVWTGAQVVYLKIFKQPLLWEAAFRGGGDALTNYWRETLEGVLAALPVLVFLLVPPIVIGVVLHKKKWEFPSAKLLPMLRMLVVGAVGIAGCVAVLLVGKFTEQDYYEEYHEFYDSLTIAENMGLWAMLERDTQLGIQHLAEGTWKGIKDFAENKEQAATEELLPGEGAEGSGDGAAEETAEETTEETTKETTEGTAEESTDETTDETSAESSGKENGEGDSEGQKEPKEPAPHQFSIDYAKLQSLADNDKQRWLAEYIEGLAPTKTNEYTGLFAGYNLIYLTAEGFSTYGIREDLTPTLYRLTHSGFIFENYYVPLWQTSTSDGEYINCTGLIPDGQFSMRKSGENDMAYVLPGFFEKDGVKSYAYHNNSLSYYDRHVTHNNLGYDFKGCKLGNLSEEEWGDKIFPMEHPNAWPASDLEMMQGTVPEYIGQDRFHVYYMTVSGHMNYNFKGNAMSYKNREAVAELPLSENARAYLACHIELDKALEYLIEQLEAAGKLENTVICLTADHYPYGMSNEQYEELAGKELALGKDLYRNSLILWNAGMEEEPVVVEKVCGSMDVLPTLLNLFGFGYDSRMYAGRDIFSDEEGMVIFNDRSFVTDGVVYNRKKKETIWLTDEAGAYLVPEASQEAYFDEKKQEVKDRYQFSAYILQEDYYSDVRQAVEETVAEQ